MTRPIRCAACRAFGATCDGRSHNCAECGDHSPVHPTSNQGANHGSQESPSQEASNEAPRQAGGLLAGPDFDDLVARVAADTSSGPSDLGSRRDTPGVREATRSVEGRARLTRPIEDPLSTFVVFAAICASMWLVAGGAHKILGAVFR